MCRAPTTGKFPPPPPPPAPPQAAPELDLADEETGPDGKRKPRRKGRQQLRISDLVATAVNSLQIGGGGGSGAQGG